MCVCVCNAVTVVLSAGSSQRGDRADSQGWTRLSGHDSGAVQGPVRAGSTAGERSQREAAPGAVRERG